jgi:hypothetical protein
VIMITILSDSIMIASGWLVRGWALAEGLGEISPSCELAQGKWIRIGCNKHYYSNVISITKAI